MIIPFHDVSPGIGPYDVGGKAASLIRLTRAGLPVPPGAVIACDFFAPWYEALAADGLLPLEGDRRHWDAGDLAQQALDRALGLPLDRLQRKALARLQTLLAGSDMAGVVMADSELDADTDPEAVGNARFAVRSSAADEDAADASFAGLFDTLLGVPAADIEQAVRRCFVASLDPRVNAYRRQRGLTLVLPRFAVVVQRQVDSEIAGVGFSVNPVTNDHDEAVFAANWGLGSTVVDGRVNPDQYVVDKVRRTLIEETRGDKSVSARLAPAGGVIDSSEPRAADRTLTDAQLEALTATICAVETLYGRPVDIEWAYAGGQLQLLQARPITTCVPLPDEMLTAPGARRRLYLDVALSKGMTSNLPFSPLGLDQMQRAFLGLVETWIGPTAPAPGSPVDAPIFFFGGRMYTNLSDLLWLMGPKRLAQGHAATDTLTADILVGVDRSRYRATSKPRWLNARLLWRLPRLLWRIRGLFWYLLKAFARPEAVHRVYKRTTSEMVASLKALQNEDLSGDDRPLDALQREMTVRMVGGFDALMAALIIGMIPPRLAISRHAKGCEALLEDLVRGTRGNVVVDMNLALHRLACMIDRSLFDDLPGLAACLDQRRLPEAVLREWDAFLDAYGWRGVNEMDVASRRYVDDPALALRQMSFMATAGGFDLQASHEGHITARQQACETFERTMGPLRRRLFRRMVRLNDLFAGARDTPKHVNVLCNHVIRRHAIREGVRLVGAGRLDAPEHVFDLTFNDLTAAAADPALDLRRVRDERTRFLRRLRTQVKTFPPVIDSRGRTLRPAAKPATPGVLVGMAVSAGVVRGPVKVLHTADEKNVVPGDILVAYTTDPGWTPLFVNAAAVVLEVGGTLQHGAVVAREFGKPCVVGIDGVVNVLTDGEWVEVDGASGTVTRVNG